MKQLGVVFLAGLIFAVGLTVSGMTLPAKVIGFLDFTGGSWDPSLVFVMGGAAVTYAIAFWWLRPKTRPWLAPEFRLPTSKSIDRRLLTGAALFGVGWGLGGYCPGPGIVSAAAFGLDAGVFLVAMLVGMLGYRFWSTAGERFRTADPVLER